MPDATATCVTAFAYRGWAIAIEEYWKVIDDPTFGGDYQTAVRFVVHRGDISIYDDEFDTVGAALVSAIACVDGEVDEPGSTSIAPSAPPQH